MGERKIKSALSETKKILNPVIIELLNSHVDKENHEIAKYQILTGGKKIRSTLTMIVSKMFNDDKMENILYPAASLEILHNYSLIIDDIIDMSEFRRNKPTTWLKFGKSIALCVGINYSAAIFQGAIKTNYPVAMCEIFARTMKRLSDGEILDLLFEQEKKENEPFMSKYWFLEITEKKYFKMIEKKTAALFETCCEVGGICANADEKKLVALKNYGLNLGMAFQIKDDALDIFGDEKIFGKKIGKDILEHKRGNIIIIIALKEMTKKDKKIFLRIMKKDKLINGDVKNAVEIIKKTDAHNKALNLGKKFIQAAKKSLKTLPQNQWNKMLGEIADFAIEREW